MPTFYSGDLLFLPALTIFIRQTDMNVFKQIFTIEMEYYINNFSQQS